MFPKCGQEKKLFPRLEIWPSTCFALRARVQLLYCDLQKLKNCDLFFRKQLNDHHKLKTVAIFTLNADEYISFDETLWAPYLLESGRIGG